MKHRVEVLHPFILSACPAVFLYVNNLKHTAIPIFKLIICISVIMVFSFIIYQLVRILLQTDRRKAGLITTAIMYIIIYFPFWYGTVPLDKNHLYFTALLIISIVTFIFISYYVLKTTRDLKGATNFINRVSFILLAFIIMNGCYDLARIKTEATIGADTPIHRKIESSNVYPSIYYIVLDGYAAQDVLADLYQFDNSDFIQFLKDKGFYVVAKSRSNYNLTVQSLASSMNSAYLDKVIEEEGIDSSNQRPLIELIRNSSIRQYLSGYGYKFIAYSSGYQATEIKNADKYIETGINIEYEKILVNATITRYILDSWLLEIESSIHQKRILQILNHISEDDDRVSSFRFVHIICPHPPFVFSDTKLISNYLYADGSDLHFNKEHLKNRYIKAYTEQITYINKYLSIVINKLLTSNKSQPIIVLQADHGPRLTTKWDSPGETDHRESLSIFNAIYLPNGERGLYEYMTPVNTFRFIRKTYFEEKTDMLKDKSYYCKGNHKPYQCEPIGNEQ